MPSMLFHIFEETLIMRLHGDISNTVKCGHEQRNSFTNLAKSPEAEA